MSPFIKKRVTERTAAPMTVERRIHSPYQLDVSNR